MRRLYYIYDSVADNMIYFCEAPSDAVAVRAFKNACDTEFKALASDLSLFCLGTLEGKNIVPDYVKIIENIKE